MSPAYEVTGGFWVDPRDQSKRHWKGEEVECDEKTAAAAVVNGVLSIPGANDEPDADDEPEADEESLAEWFKGKKLADLQDADLSADQAAELLEVEQAKQAPREPVVEYLTGIATAPDEN